MVLIFYLFCSIKYENETKFFLNKELAVNISERLTLLEKKRISLEVALTAWAIENKILNDNEQLKFELRVVDVPFVAGKVSDEAIPKFLLPHDIQFTNARAKEISTFKLSAEDWGLLAKLPWNHEQKVLVDDLRANGNHPVDIGAYMPTHLTRTMFHTRFSNVLKLADHDTDSPHEDSHGFELILLAKRYKAYKGKDNLCSIRKTICTPLKK